MRPSRLRSGVIASLLLVGVAAPTRAVRADAFTVGVGPEYSQLSLPGTASHPNADFSGPGVLIDARIRLGAAREFGEFGVDFFGQFGFAYDSNNAAGTSESLTRSQVGGGIDLRTAWVFAGVQVMSTNASVNNSALGESTSLSATSLGFRGGINYVLNDETSLMLGADRQTATVQASSSNGLSADQPMNQVGLFIQLNYKLIWGRSDSPAVSSSDHLSRLFKNTE